MFYNTYRATKSALRKRQLSGTHTNSFVNPKERLLNQQKRQKLKNLLITKFIQKYNITNPDEILEPVINEFIQMEKLNDVDLKRLDIKIQKLIKNKSSRDNLKMTLTHNLQENNLPGNQLQNQNEVNEINAENQRSISPPVPLSNTIDNNNNANNISTNINNNEFPTINPLNTYSNTIIKNENNNNIKKNRGYSSYTVRSRKNNYFKSPAEELAELEKELAEEELKKKKVYDFMRIDIPRGGDEWGTIVKYNKILYDRQLLEEKIKDKTDKRRTKEFLDSQVKEKIKKEYEDELKEKEYNKIMEEHYKKMDEIERVKAQKIKEQIKRLKENRDIQLKNEKMRKRIEELKEKKFDSLLVKNYQQNLEIIRKEKFDKKKRENEALRKAIKENEIKQQLLKEQIKKEKENEIKLNEERLKIDLRKEDERNRYYQKIKNKSNKYTMKQAEEIVEKLKKEQKAEDDKIQYYYDAKNKEANEKEVRERLRRQKEREYIKKYLDMQIEERKKDENFLKLLDEEQARIWNIDCKKYMDDEKIVERKIKLMNKKNFDCLMNQIEEKQRSKSKQNIMSDSEFAMNRELLQKAKQEEKMQIAQ